MIGSASLGPETIGFGPFNASAVDPTLVFSGSGSESGPWSPARVEPTRVSEIMSSDYYFDCSQVSTQEGYRMESVSDDKGIAGASDTSNLGMTFPPAMSRNTVKDS